MRKSLFVLATSLLILVAAAGPATAHPVHPAPPGVAHAMGYYLALGDSLAAGYQPDQGDDKTGGYVGGTLAAIKFAKPKTRLTNLACSGETVVTLVSGGRCSYELGSQLAQAVDFLEHHGRFTRVITLNIGSNDVQTCVDRATLVIDMMCIQNGFTNIDSGLPAALATLRSLAPKATIIVLNYYNPFLAAYLAGPAGQAVAQQSTSLQAQLNSIIAKAAAANGATLADVAAVFKSTDWTPVAVPGFGTLPTNVGMICRWTLMCTNGDIHPNDEGYAVIAATVVAHL